jgi:hypothetical protein
MYDYLGRFTTMYVADIFADAVLRLEEEGPCGEHPQCLYFLQCLQQPLADPV